MRGILKDILGLLALAKVEYAQAEGVFHGRQGLCRANPRCRQVAFLSDRQAIPMLITTIV